MSQPTELLPSENIDAGSNGHGQKFVEGTVLCTIYYAGWLSKVIY